MKKIVLFALLISMGVNTAFAGSDQLVIEREGKYQKQVMQIGFRILNANQIENRMVFYYNNSKNVNAVCYSVKRIDVYKGLLPFLDSDDELAGIMSHEIAHGLDFSDGYLRRWGMTLKPKKYEEKADKRAVDLMVNAGYNPVALIVALNKITSEPAWFEASSSHPVGSERLVYIYEYIYSKYPAYLADNDYKNNLYYQNFLLNSKKQREFIRQKYAEKSTVPVTNKKKNSK